MPDLEIDIQPSFQSVGQMLKDIATGWRLQEELEKFAFRVEAESKKVTPVDTGRLRASINTTIRPLEAQVAPHTNYALYVHEGTRFMRARPFLTWGYNTVAGADPSAPFKAHIESVINNTLR